MGITVQQFLSAVDNVYKMAHNGGFRYSNSVAMPPCSDGKISCDRIVARALWDLGITDQQQGGVQLGLGQMPEWLRTHGFTEIKDQNQVTTGDVIIFKNANNPNPLPLADGHVFVVTSYDPNTKTCSKYDMGDQWRIQAAQPFTNVPFDQWPNRTFYGAYRIGGGSNQQGVINPGKGWAINPTNDFVETAVNHVGKSGKSWVRKTVGIKATNWSGSFVLAVAKECGYLGKIFPKNVDSPAHLLYEMVTKYHAVVLGNLKNNFTPGDIVVLPNSNIKNSEQYAISNPISKLPSLYKDVSKIGIVECVEGTSLVVIEGGADNGSVLRKKYSLKKDFYLTIRPYWTGVIPDCNPGSYSSLYETSSTRADATIKEVCYLGLDGEPSITKTDIKLSIINYTSLLAEFVGMFGGSGTSPAYDIEGSPDNIEALPEVPRQIVKYLTTHGLNTAASVGIIGNMKRESSFRLDAVGDKGTSFGLVQWHLDRGARMKQACGGGDKWKTNLTGQLDFLMTELNDGYSGVLKRLQSVSNDLSGAKEAAEVFVRKFEEPPDIENEVRIRNQYTEEFWSQIIVNNSRYSPQNSSSPGGGVSSDSSIQGRKAIKTIVIPNPLDGGYPNQTGIIGDLTNYVSYFTKWHPKYGPRRVADVWDAKGRKQNHMVSTIDGYYIVAVKQRFGDNGDLIQVVLDDNTKINCIIGDTKGSDAQSPWGHVFGQRNGVSLIEWESFGVSDGEQMNGYLRQWGIYQKKVKQITNYGRYC